MDFQTRDTAASRSSQLDTRREIRLLPAARFYNCHLGCHLLPLFHTSHNDQTTVRDQQPAMIHGRIGSIVADRLPRMGVNIKSKSHTRRLSWFPVITDSVVVVM